MKTAATEYGDAVTLQYTLYQAWFFKIYLYTLRILFKHMVSTSKKEMTKSPIIYPTWSTSSGHYPFLLITYHVHRNARGFYFLIPFLGLDPDSPCFSEFRRNSNLCVLRAAPFMDGLHGVASCSPSIYTRYCHHLWVWTLVGIWTFKYPLEIFWRHGAP